MIQGCIFNVLTQKLDTLIQQDPLVNLNMQQQLY